MSEAVATSILGLGSAFPASVEQTVAASLAASLCGQGEAKQQWLTHLFERTGVERRGSVLASNHGARADVGLRQFYPVPTGPDDRGPSTAARMQQYAARSPALAQGACEAALADAALSAGEITHLITVSCTGFFAPGLDVALVRRLGLSPSVQRLHIGFMGCHAAFNALAAAVDIVRSRPEARVLLVCVELCSLHFAYGWHPQRIVANSLFADGAAAAVVGRGSGAMQLLSNRSLLLPDCEDAMAWCIGDNGFEMTLSPAVPDLIQAHVRPWLSEWLTATGRSVDGVSHWAIHPGGPKVLTSVCAALGLDPDACQLSRQVLAQHGNISSATILVILETLRQQRPQGDCVALGFGPGLMAEALLLRFR